MTRKNIILIFIILLLIIAFFTKILKFTDDPTTQLVLVYNPFFEQGEDSNYIILLSDENKLIGEKLLLFIYKLRLILLVFTLILFLKDGSPKETNHG